MLQLLFLHSKIIFRYRSDCIILALFYFCTLLAQTSVILIFQVSDTRVDSTETNFMLNKITSEKEIMNKIEQTNIRTKTNENFVSKKKFINQMTVVINNMEKYFLKFQEFKKLQSNSQKEIIFILNSIKYSEFVNFDYYIKTYYLPPENFCFDHFHSMLYILNYFKVEFDLNCKNIIRNLLFNLNYIINTLENLLNEIEIKFIIEDYFSFKLFNLVFEEYCFLILNEKNYYMIIFMT
ncbi:hypothetical protein CWI36_0012p0030 [Hamiltosporidium magnivora]|uniref:Transmembrane protein n=1 Tax=Hamiltosporidium magnivora TaxID=148818 RepID=A0A4Q9LNU8_9MICR|nr:hypothetical protein CWI36_0012p0030 [Hamiltosporidium magnivora]